MIAEITPKTNRKNLAHDFSDTSEPKKEKILQRPPMGPRTGITNIKIVNKKKVGAFIFVYPLKNFELDFLP